MNTAPIRKLVLVGLAAAAAGFSAGVGYRTASELFDARQPPPEPTASREHDFERDSPTVPYEPQELPPIAPEEPQDRPLKPRIRLLADQR